ncbi:MAG TPA: hypothetical protein VNG51_28265 [Ktedonobacteraceae bacterium]|nr:hypothetical protein [Ktedonobacteraceae bacterium]
MDSESATGAALNVEPGVVPVVLPLCCASACEAGCFAAGQQAMASDMSLRLLSTGSPNYDGPVIHVTRIAARRSNYNGTMGL